MIKSLLTTLLFLTVLWLFKPVGVIGTCINSSQPIEGYINTCSSPMPPPPTSNYFCQQPWTTWCDYGTYPNICGAFGNQTDCQNANGNLCGGWGSCLWCSGVYGNCTAWSACSPSCGPGTQTRTCYDTLCGLPQTQPQSCNNGPCCPATVSISGNVLGVPTGYTSTVRAGAYASNIVNPPGGTYTISGIPKNTSGLSFYATDLSAYYYSVSPGTTTINTVCSNITNKNFSYSCASNGTCSGTCTYNGSAWTCPDNCGNPVSCPAPPNAAGVVSSQGAINSGSGKISQGGTDPGYRLTNYTSAVNTTSVNYNNLLSTVLKNSGFYATTALDANANCSGGGVVSTSSYNIYCYTSSTFNSTLASAIANGTAAKTMVLYPKGNISLAQAVSAAKTVTANGQIVIVFVNGDLAVNSNVSIPATYTGSGIIFVINGNLTASPTVTVLDGVYVFAGGFDDGNSQTALTGKGSLLSIGTGNFLFNRYLASNATPSERWTYEPKYLVLFEQSLATTKYTWQELSPQ